MRIEIEKQEAGSPVGRASWPAQALDERGHCEFEHNLLARAARFARQRRRNLRTAEVEMASSYPGAESSIKLRDNCRLIVAAVICALQVAALQRGDGRI